MSRSEKWGERELCLDWLVLLRKKAIRKIHVCQRRHILQSDAVWGIEGITVINGPKSGEFGQIYS